MLLFNDAVNWKGYIMASKHRNNGSYSKVYGIARWFLSSLNHVAITVVYELLTAYFTHKGKRKSRVYRHGGGN